MGKALPQQPSRSERRSIRRCLPFCPARGFLIVSQWTEILVAALAADISPPTCLHVACPFAKVVAVFSLPTRIRRKGSHAHVHENHAWPGGGFCFSDPGHGRTGREASRDEIQRCEGNRPRRV